MKKEYLKNKIINQLLINGEKKTCEKILLKTVKELQKNSNKQTSKILQIALINSTPIFKVHTLTNKKRKKNKKFKEIPTFIEKALTRFSLAIKFILFSITKKNKQVYYKKLKEELLASAELKGISINIKNELHKKVIANKHLFKYYQWK